MKIVQLCCVRHIIYVILYLLQQEIAKLITLEQGKTLVDAEGDVMRGLRKFLISVYFLACLFQRKIPAFVITRSSSLLSLSLSLLSFSLSSSCKKFNVTHYSKSMQGIDTKLGILAHHDNVHLQDKRHNFESCSFGSYVPF